MKKKVLSLFMATAFILFGIVSISCQLETKSEPRGIFFCSFEFKKCRTQHE